MLRRNRKKTTGLLLLAALVLSLVPIGAFAKVQANKNYRMTPAGFLRGKDGPGLAHKPGNTSHIVEINADWITAQCEYGVSMDKGKTWKRGLLKAPDGFNVTCDSLGHGSSSLDSSIQFGTGNNVFTTFGASKGTGDGQSAIVAKSTDGGMSYPMSVVAMAGGDNAVNGPAYRYPKLLVQGNTVHVVAWDSAGSSSDPANPQYDRIVAAKSTDGGMTWSTPVTVSDPAERAIEPSQIVGHGNDLYTVYRVRGNTGKLVLAKSTDGGATWTRTDIVDVKGFVAGTTQFPASTFPRLAVDPGTGNLYVVYQQVPNDDGSYPGQADHFIGPDADILFVKSTDGGATWTKPVILNDLFPGSLTQNRHPNVAVAPNGRVDVTWHDRRHSFGIETCPNTHAPPAGTAPCTETRLGDTYYVWSDDEGATWSDNRRITDRSINNDVGFDQRFGTYWDFGPIALPLGNSEILFAWMDSRKGNVQTDNQDIYFSLVELNAGKVPVDKKKAKNDVVLSKKASKLTYPGGNEAVLAATFASRPWSRLVIVNKKDDAGALAGSVLARAYLGSVLLSNRKGLPGKTKKEVSRFDPNGAFLIGNKSKLTNGVKSDLIDLGVDPDNIDDQGGIARIGGATSHAVAANIALLLDKRTDAEKTAGDPAFDAVVIANPDSPQAGVAAALAANRRLPILFVNRESTPADTDVALQTLDIDKTLVIGGTDAVSESVVASLPGAIRIGDNSLSGTTRAVAMESIARRVPSNIVYVVGPDVMHAALAGAAAGRTGALLFVTPGAKVGPARTDANALGITDGLDRFIRMFTG